MLLLLKDYTDLIIWEKQSMGKEGGSLCLLNHIINEKMKAAICTISIFKVRFILEKSTVIMTGGDTKGRMAHQNGGWYLLSTMVNSQ